jgi:hypothetical protein
VGACLRLDNPLIADPRIALAFRKSIGVDSGGVFTRRENNRNHSRTHQVGVDPTIDRRIWSDWWTFESWDRFWYKMWTHCPRVKSTHQPTPSHSIPAESHPLSGTFSLTKVSFTRSVSRTCFVGPLSTILTSRPLPRHLLASGSRTTSRSGASTCFQDPASPTPGLQIPAP